MDQGYVQALVTALEEAERRYADSTNPLRVRGYGLGRVLDTFGLVLLQDVGTGDAPPGEFVVRTGETAYRVPAVTLPIHAWGDPGPGVRAAASWPPCPGAPIAAHPGLRHGAIAGVLRRDPAWEPRYLLTAAHLFKEANDGDPVFLGERPIGTLWSRLRKPYYDVAVIEASDAAVRTWADRTPHGEVATGGIRPPDFADVGEPAYLFRPTTDRVEATVIVAGSMTIRVLPGTDGWPLTQIDVIMTRACTTPGDSGTALLDARGNFLGIATGRVAEYSFFSGADAVLRHPLVGPLV